MFVYKTLPLTGCHGNEASERYCEKVVFYFTVADLGIKERGGRMASADREPITKVPQRGPGAEPLVKGPGTNHPEAESRLDFLRPKDGENVASFEGFLCSF